MKLTGDNEKKENAAHDKAEAKKPVEKSCMLLTDDELERVNGGAIRPVDTGLFKCVRGVVRAGPGLEYGQIGSIDHGDYVVTTGNDIRNAVDGKTWYEIKEPIYGWVAGELIGYR